MNSLWLTISSVLFALTIESRPPSRASVSHDTETSSYKALRYACAWDRDKVPVWVCSMAFPMSPRSVLSNREDPLAAKFRWMEKVNHEGKGGFVLGNGRR